MTVQNYAIIVAGGSGSRMKSEIPKQFLELNGQPILMHTLRAFYFDSTELILVLPEPQFEYWISLCEKHSFTISYKLVKGGETRFHSVKNGLDSIEGTEGLVAIHDGVRPIIKKEIIDNAYHLAAKHGSAIASVPLKDSIRVINQEGNSHVDRVNYRLIQTPQTFQLQLIKKAFEAGFRQSFTDDASVFEFSGQKVHLFEGDYRNIKITTPEDLQIAETFLAL